MSPLRPFSWLRTWIARLPLRHKLLLKSNVVAIVAALAVSSVFAVHRLLALRAGHLSDALAITRIVAENSAGAVAFQDSAAATAMLASLRAKPAVVGAAIALTPERDLAVYGLVPPAALRLGKGAAQRFDGWTLHTAAAIGDNDSNGATLHLMSDLRPELWMTLRAFFLALAAALALALPLSYFASIRLRQFIIGPIEVLHAATRRVGATIDYTHRAPVLTQDELGDLTRAFNGMLDRLQTANAVLRTTNDSLTGEIAERHRLERALVDTSRQAGMAEVATGILHNVGNVLNSVNISAQLIREQLGHSQLGNLTRVADLIRAQADRFPQFVADDPKGRLVPQFIIDLSTALTTEHGTLDIEVRLLAKNIEHIKEIISAQQGLAKRGGVIETVSPASLFAEALLIVRASLQRHGVDVIEDYAPASPLSVDRHRALQILVNFVTNAIHAVEANAPGQRRIVLRVAPTAPDIAFSVADNGVGIAAKNLTRVFTHGFTTRHDGHGFGLHSGAIAARLLGGHVRVESDGPGRGATFILVLPPVAARPTLEPDLT